jgi:hypothetical protein
MFFIILVRAVLHQYVWGRFQETHILNLCSVTVELIRETIAANDYINEEINSTACNDTNN